MKTQFTLATFVLAFAATPVLAQITPRTPGGRTTTSRDRIEEARARIEAARQRAGIETGDRRTTSGSSKVPKGHLPPRGMCRVWIDGVPPGHQPPVTSCSQAESDRYRYGAGARVIYGDDQAFPGKGKGKFKNASGSTRECSIWDRVMTSDGRTATVCRDDRVSDRRTSRSGNIYDRVYGDRVYDRDGDGRIDDDDRYESAGGKGKFKQGKAAKGNGKAKGKKGRA